MIHPKTHLRSICLISPVIFGSTMIDICTEKRFQSGRTSPLSTKTRNAAFLLLTSPSALHFHSLLMHASHVTNLQGISTPEFVETVFPTFISIDTFRSTTSGLRSKRKIPGKTHTYSMDLSSAMKKKDNVIVQIR